MSPRGGASPARVRARLEELEETLRAIRSGEVDALVVSGRNGERVFTLEGPDSPFRALVEQMGEGAATASPDGIVLYANRRFARQCGAPLQRVVGSSIYRFWKPAAAERLRRLAARASSSPARAEESLPGSGEALDVQVSISRLTAYEKPALLFVVTDVTDKKRHEALIDSAERLRRFNAELERRVEARTSELQALNADLEAFCYSATHDLRAPLRGISGFGELLRRDLGPRLPAPARERLRRIQDATRRMGDVIDGLLSLSRLGRGEFRREPLDLSALAREHAAELRRAEPRRRAKVRVQPGLAATGDRRLASMLIHNLLQNAWKFAKRGGPVVEVARAGDGFVVRDHGIGFEQEYAESLFLPFKRLHSREQYPGTGIGLSLARRIVVRHGGTIRAEGVPGRGAAFFFTLGGGRPRRRR